jgi:hypothetical protein
MQCGSVFCRDRLDAWGSAETFLRMGRDHCGLVSSGGVKGFALRGAKISLKAEERIQ